MAQELRSAEWRETVGELGALLVEARLVKDMQPIFNRQLRCERSLYACMPGGWRLADDPTANYNCH